MDPSSLKRLLTSVQDGEIPVPDALKRLARLPFEDLGHTHLDTHRALRCGHPEVIYGAGKTPDQLVDIAKAALDVHETLLVTRVSNAGAQALLAAVPDAIHHDDAQAVSVERGAGQPGVGDILVISAGTSDRPVAEEAVLTARLHGARVKHLPDVGVAGLHRLLAHTERLRQARVVVVVAGMEGALPSVVGGLVDRPVIAVPTSVGYGASFGGLSALLGMLNSCAAGVTVVNIDNGFGAGVAAARINQTLSPTAQA